MRNNSSGRPNLNERQYKVAEERTKDTIEEICVSWGTFSDFDNLQH